MPRSQPPYCPQCQQLDGVRKVSAIYDAETRVVSTPAGPSFSSTRLAARLAPPDPPEPHRLRSIRWMVHADLGRVVALSSLLLALTELKQPGSWWYFAIPPLLWGLALLAWLLVRQWLAQRDAARMAVWEAEVAAWYERYYCGRCDETFVPVPKASRPYTGSTIRLGP
jgi:hypothetical protein